jgi:hypothetical protein
MKSINSGAAVAGDQRLLEAMDAYINEPSMPMGFTLKESMINLLGGPADAVGHEYDYRDACKALLRLVNDNLDSLGHYKILAHCFVSSAVGFFEDCITSESLRAEIHRNVIEVFGCQEMTPAAVDNLIKQYELKRQLAILEGEAVKIKRLAA